MGNKRGKENSQPISVPNICSVKISRAKISFRRGRMQHPVP